MLVTQDAEPEGSQIQSLLGLYTNLRSVWATLRGIAL